MTSVTWGWTRMSTHRLAAARHIQLALATLQARKQVLAKKPFAETSDQGLRSMKEVGASLTSTSTGYCRLDMSDRPRSSVSQRTPHCGRKAAGPGRRAWP
jgi:hypothetical protein